MKLKDMIINFEKNDSRFYSKMSKRVQDRGLKDLLFYLAMEEAKHIKEI
jgi:rubrerythrin